MNKNYYFSDNMTRSRHASVESAMEPEKYEWKLVKNLESALDEAEIFL